jgi:hypothetical protein
MPILSASGLLDLWDRGTNRHPLDRALLLLEASNPQKAHAELADWTIARRDAALLKLRCSLFGPTLDSYLDCPRCRERLEFSVDGEGMISGKGEWNEEKVEAAGSRFRLPTSRDLAKIALDKNSDEAIRRLAQLCLADGPDKVPDWSVEQLREIDSRLEEADPMGNIQLDFNCGNCGHRWEEAFDIGEFLWEEIEAQARKLLGEVHQLAAAYGWTEREILSMSDARRRTYMEWVSP